MSPGEPGLSGRRAAACARIESNMPMRHLIRMGDRSIPMKAKLAIFLVLALAPSAWAGEWKGSCDIRFRGTSTIHDFTGNVRCQPIQVGGGDVADGKTIIPGAEVAALAAEMDTGEKTRDRQMREMFQSDKFPRIRGIFTNIDPGNIRRDLRKSPDGKVPLDFTLRIRDIERPVHGVLSNFRERDGVISFDVDYAVSLKDYRLVPPKVFFGIVRVDDKVTVTTAVRLEAAGPK